MRHSRILLMAVMMCMLACSKPAGPVFPSDGLMRPAPCSNKVVAHRCGAYEAGLPENSLEALAYAMKIGAYAAECDVYWTADDDVIVAHADANYQVNGLLPFEHTVAEIRAAGKLANGEDVPTLREYLAAVMVEGNCTKLMIDIKKLDGASLTYVAKCAKRTCEIIDEMGAVHFVDLLCTGADENTMKTAWGYAHELGVDIGMNSGKTPSQLNALGFGWANISAPSLIPAAGGNGTADPEKYAAAGVALSVYSIDSQKYNGDSLYGRETIDYVVSNIGLFKCLVSNFPVWLISTLSQSTKTYDGISNADEFKAFAEDIQSDPYAKRFQNSAGEVVLKTDLTLNDFVPLGTFKGVLDGSGKTITINYSGSATRVGLFKSLQGTVKNLTVAGNIDILCAEGEAHVGAFAADATAAVLSNCRSAVAMTVNENSGTKQRCFVTGGLLGKIWNGCTVSDCEFSGSLHFNSPGYCLAGGIVGGSNADEGVASITGSRFLGTMTLAGSNGSDWNYVGGITGKMQSTLLTGTKYGLVISGCTNSGKIGISGSAKVRGGGIASYAKVCNCISGCTMNGTIEVGAAALERNVGGICGYQEATCDALVKDCVFDGTITCASGASKPYYIGGVISSGYSAAAVVDGCKTTSKASVSNTSLGSIGMIACSPKNAMTIKNCQVAGTIVKAGEKTAISATNLESWMIIGSAATAAVKQ